LIYTRIRFVTPTNQDDAWAIVLAAANEAERVAEVGNAVAFAAVLPPDSDAAELRAVPAGDRDAALAWRPESGWEVLLPPGDPAHALIDLYLPICSATVARPITVGHLGQSIDGFIATHAGESQFVTGEENIRHLHRMRALCDAVIVGAGTVAHDDPRLTTRLVSGASPLRVVIDPRVCDEIDLSKSFKSFVDGRGREAEAFGEVHLPETVLLP